MKYILLFLLPILCFGNVANHPFDYDLHIHVIPGSNERTLICFHGYGSSYRLIERLKKLNVTDSTLVGFNFPDYHIGSREYDLKNIAFGTIKEILPACFVLKKFIIDEKLDEVDIYGFSAGGGTVINTLAVLNSDEYDAELATIGIGKKEKQILLEAIQKGIVLLDSPLKSIEEILELRGYSEELQLLAKIYRTNRMVPLESVDLLQGLSLDIIVYFEEMDEVIFNRDDDLFIEKLEKINSKGSTTFIIANDGGHNAPHWSLWRAYNQKIVLLRND